MADRKIIAIVGATGAQGGGLARAILEDKSGGFAVRAITRSADKAKALAAAGAEVAVADIGDAAAVKKAFEGAHGAFCVTNFWEHFSPEKEQAQVRAMADAARAAGLRHVVWSTLEDTRKWVPLSDDRMPTLGGKWKVPHLDAKGEVDHVWTDLGVPTTFLLTSFYWDNFIHFGLGPKPNPDGTLAITLPIGKAKLSGIAAEDIGRAVYGIFKRGQEMIGKTVAIAAEHLTGEQMAMALAKALGKKVVYNEVTPAAFRGFGFPGADDLGNMFQFMRDFEAYFTGVRDVAKTRELNPRLQSLDQWLEANKARVPLG